METLKVSFETFETFETLETFETFETLKSVLFWNSQFYIILMKIIFLNVLLIFKDREQIYVFKLISGSTSRF